MHDMPMGAKGRRNDSVTAPKTQRLHQRLGHINRTLHADIEKPTSLEKTLIIYTKINFCFYEKKIKFCWKNLHLIVGTTQYCDTQQTIHNTTNNTQHKTYSCYIISFDTLFAFDCWHSTVLWYTTNNTQHNKQYTTQNT